MKLVIQKVSSASVEVDGTCVGKIGKGFLVLAGIGQEDTREIADQYIKKMVNLRIFEDSDKPFPGGCKGGGSAGFTVYAVRQLQKRKST